MGDRTVCISSYSPVDHPASEMICTKVNHPAQKYPFCIVWTPIPFLTWIFPFIGHMGIAMSSGVIRDFAGSYIVGTGNMAFGKPTKYWQMDSSLANGGAEGWDRAVTEASDVYKSRIHNLCCDNCHSHVAMALNKMKYNNSSSWNMVKLASGMFFRGKYVSVAGFLYSWTPFVVFIILMFCLTFVKLN